MDTSAPDYIESIGFKVLDYKGEPAPIGDLSHDFPLAEIASKIGGVDVVQAGLGYTYTQIEVGKAMEMANAQGFGGAINYLAEKPIATRTLTEQWLDRVAFIGDARWPSLATGGLVKYGCPSAGYRHSAGWCEQDHCPDPGSGSGYSGKRNADVAE